MADRTSRRAERVAGVTKLARGRLGDGMVIAAKVRARLLGMKILDLDADVTVLPAAERVSTETAVEASVRPRRTAARAELNGTVGSSLAAVARSIEESEARLEESRRRMP